MTYLVFYAVIIKFFFSLHAAGPRPPPRISVPKAHKIKKRHEKNQKVSHDRGSVIASGRHRFSKTSAQLLKIPGLESLMCPIQNAICHPH